MQSLIVLIIREPIIKYSGNNFMVGLPVAEVVAALERLGAVAPAGIAE